jgi:hypothetical protein
MLFIAAYRKSPGLAGKALQTAAVALARLTRRLYETSRPNEILTALREGNLAALYGCLDLEEASVLVPLIDCDPECLEELLQLTAGQGTTNRETRREVRFTAFGGAFLLFPLLDQLPFSDAASSWPEFDGSSAVAIARFLVLAKCFVGHAPQGV